MDGSFFHLLTRVAGAGLHQSQLLSAPSFQSLILVSDLRLKQDIMGYDANINQGQVPSLFNRLILQPGFKTGLLTAGAHFKSKLAVYPPQSHRPMVFVSAAQRRGFFGRLRAGEIQVPYPRGTAPSSEALGRKWETKASNNGYTVTTGNNASYAGLVQGQKQSLYHKVTGWNTAEKVVNTETPIALRIVGVYVRRDIKGM